jgi:hypothetical protein
MVVVLAALAGCAGATADAPLRVKLGISRDQAIHDLRAAKFCFTPDGPAQPVETFQRCDSPGSDWAEAWVVARYDQLTLVELRRYERFNDDARALERFNQLVAARAELSPDAGEAGKVALTKDGALEPGTKMVKAFRADADTIVGVYLLTPQPPDHADILEAVVRVKH